MSKAEKMKEELFEAIKNGRGEEVAKELMSNVSVVSVEEDGAAIKLSPKALKMLNTGLSVQMRMAPSEFGDMFAVIGGTICQAIEEGTDKFGDEYDYIGGEA